MSEVIIYKQSEEHFQQFKQRYQSLPMFKEYTHFTKYVESFFHSYD